MLLRILRLLFGGSSNLKSETPVDDVDLDPSVRVCNLVLSQAIREQVQEIVMEPLESDQIFAIRYQSGAELTDVMTPPLKDFSAVRDHFRKLAGIAEGPNRLSNQGSATFHQDGVEHRLQVILDGETVRIKL